MHAQLLSQVDVSSPRTSALLLFMRRSLGEPAFTELRTKKQLGYVVSLSVGGYGRYQRSDAITDDVDDDDDDVK